jgi:peptidyl-prolyl cis-trans isomerase C
MRAIVVHGVEIPESLLAQEAQNHPSLSAAEARTAAGHALATKALLLRRGAELGLIAEPELDDDGREETAEAALIRAVLEAEIEVASPTDAECRRVYDAQRSKFQSPPLYEASHILIEPVSSDPSDVEVARLRTIELRAILAKGVCTFAEMARDHSSCPSGAVGGSLGQLRPGDLVAEVEDALGRLEPGETGGEPIRSRFGWHILKLERRIDGHELPFEVAAERIRMHLESRAWGVAASRFVVALAEAARESGVALTLSEDGRVMDGSVCLGDFLGDGAAAERLVPWLAVVDPALSARLDQAAGASGIEPLAFVRAAAAEFVGHADDERWTQLISAARDGVDPALAALSSILQSKLTPTPRTFTVIGRRAASGAAPLSGAAVPAGSQD